VTANASSVTLVVPTVREDCLTEFIARWKALGLFERVHLLIVEDNPDRTFQTPDDIDCTHICWMDIERALGDDAWIIPRRSDTVRSYGYLWAWQRRSDFVLTLDDDCYPCTEGERYVYRGPEFVDQHLKWLCDRPRWYSTLTSVKPRGMPYYNVGRHERVMLNHGLWTHVLDYDAPSQLANPAIEVHAKDNRIVPMHSYFPMCGMNVMWRNEITVLMYHVLMGHGRGAPFCKDRPDQLVKLPFDRFGDIWCGILVKKILDTKGAYISTGLPYIRHERASNPFTNLKKEANALEVNEYFWEHVDAAALSPSRSFAELYADLGKHVARWDRFPEHASYFALLGRAMETWTAFFSR
jgi:hypothetical protein